MSKTEVDYLNHRAQQHRDRSSACADQATRSLHQRFAEEYSARAGQMAAALLPIV